MLRRNLTGEVFGSLVVSRFVELDNHHRAYWEVICRCGTAKVVRGDGLVSGAVVSCGCYHKLLMTQMWTGRTDAITHGHTRHKRPSPEYRTWDSMKRRCQDPDNPKYDFYGGRGISICAQWLGETGFATFLADMGERPVPKHDFSIDRIDNDGNYKPGNCRWADKSVQRRNQRDIRYRNEAGQYACA